jgi:hypothetical protein
VTGIVVTPSFNVIIPTTLESWAAGLITRLGLGLAANRTFGTKLGQVIVSASAIGTFGIYRNPAKVAYTEKMNEVVTPKVGPENVINGAICPRHSVNTCDNAGNNPLVSMQAGVNVTWAPKDWLFFSLSYGIQPNWNYASTKERDENTSKAVDSNGDPVASVGIGNGLALQSGSVSVAINLTDAISASLYVWNWAPIWSSEVKRWRFPFWDFDGPANNYTVMGLSLSATY